MLGLSLLALSNWTQFASRFLAPSPTQMTIPAQASFANGNPLQVEAVRRGRNSGMWTICWRTLAVLLGVSWFLLRGSLWFYVRPFELICTVSLGDRFLQCHDHQAREAAWPLSLSSEAENQHTRKGKRWCKRRSFMFKGTLQSWGSQEQKGGKDGSQVRWEGTVWTELLAMLLSAVRKHSKWEERWYLLSSYLGPLFCVCMPTLEEKATGKLPSPDMKCCLYSCVPEPSILHPGGGGRI